LWSIGDTVWACSLSEAALHSGEFMGLESDSVDSNPNFTAKSYMIVGKSLKLCSNSFISSKNSLE
jgi:hypothetical protein